MKCRNEHHVFERMNSCSTTEDCCDGEICNIGAGGSVCGASEGDGSDTDSSEEGSSAREGSGSSEALAAPKALAAPAALRVQSVAQKRDATGTADTGTVRRERTACVQQG